MKASDFIAKFLSKHSNYAFGGQGSSVVHIVDSIYKNKNINFIPGQSEQGSSLAADAYYRSSKKIGITIGTSGPGILNFLQGMACSYFDSVPGLYIAGAPPVSYLRKNKKIRQIGFQEMEVQNMVKPICKYSTLVKKIEDLNHELEKCIDIAFSGRKGPTLIEIPDDISRMDMPKKLKHFKPKKTNKTKKKSNNTRSRIFTCSLKDAPSEKAKIFIEGPSAYETTAIGIKITYSNVEYTDKGAFILTDSSKDVRSWFIGAISLLQVGNYKYLYDCK